MPEKIPHIAPPASAHNGNSQNGQDKAHGNGSPIKEHTFLHRESSLNREASADDIENENEKETSNKA